MSCAKFECAGVCKPNGQRNGIKSPCARHNHPCCCGSPWSEHSDAARGIEQPAQEAALPELVRLYPKIIGRAEDMRPDPNGWWCDAGDAEVWRTEALRQRERADGLEGERAELLKRVAERDGWVCELRERAEKAEAECLEQARLLGVGGEREAALLGKVERLERELAALKAEHAAALDRVRYSLRIYIHAHATGNSVPPHLVQQAGEALRDKEGAKC